MPQYVYSVNSGTSPIKYQLVFNKRGCQCHLRNIRAPAMLFLGAPGSSQGNLFLLIMFLL